MAKKASPLPSCGCRWKCRRSPPAARRIFPRAWRRPWRRGSRARSCHLPLQRRGDRVVVGEIGRTLSPTIWPVSWPLPAISSTSPFFSAAMPARIACARSPISVAPGAAARMAARIAAGCSLRGLSSVTMTRSAFSAAMRAHDRPLARVAVAAGAEHHHQLAAGIGAQRLERLRQRVGLVRVVDEDRRAVACCRPAPAGPWRRRAFPARRTRAPARRRWRWQDRRQPPRSAPGRRRPAAA